MTTPMERTRSLVWARELIRDLFKEDMTLEEARRQAKYVLRHYPDAGEIRYIVDNDIRAGMNDDPIFPMLMLEHYTPKKDAE